MKMTNYVIHPIPLAEMTIDKSMLKYRCDIGQKYTQLVYAWYLEGPGEKILVDAGVSVDYLLNVRDLPSREIQPLESGLKKLGLAPEDITLVIITHLHSDHIAEGYKLPNARFIVQKAELDFARNPHVTVAAQYPSQFIEGLNYQTVEGDTEICDGISVISTTGHSHGGQSVAVQTAKGLAIITGQCTIDENFAPPENIAMQVIPPGVMVNLFGVYDSLLKVKQMADIIIPNHEPKYVQINHIP